MSWERRISIQQCTERSVARRIPELELRLGVRFPQTYKASISEAEGCRPLSPCFAISKPQSQRAITDVEDIGVELDVEEIDTFLLVSEDRGELGDVYSVDSWLARISKLQPGAVPFAIDLADNPLCFDYRNGEAEPKIVYLDMEREGADALWFVADSFSSLLENLLDVE